MGGWIYWLFMLTRDASIEWMILYYGYLYTSADDARLHVNVVWGYCCLILEDVALDTVELLK